MPNISIIAPCYNEEGNIPLLAGRIAKAFEKSSNTYTLILVDDGSHDSTSEQIHQLIVDGNPVIHVKHQENKGIYEAWLSGLKEVPGGLVCLIDADLQNPPEDIQRLFEKLQSSNHDFIQGTRSEIDRESDFRFWASRALNRILNFTFGDDANDSKSGFIIGPKFAFDDSLPKLSGYKYPQTFIRIAARSRGYSVGEVETLFGKRATGVSFLAGAKAFKVSLESISDIVRAIFRIGRVSADPRNTYLFTRNRNVKQNGHPYRGFRRVWFELYFATMPLHKWLISRRARNIYLQLKDAEFMSASEIENLQLDRLNRLVHHSINRVPYYRRTLSGIWNENSHISSLSQLNEAPLLNKSDVRENAYFDLFSSDHKKREMHRISTSGSTGEPFTTYADKFQLEVRFASTLRAAEMTGWKFGDKQARLWHQTLGMSKSQVVRERIDKFFMRRIFIPAFEIKDNNLERYVEKIRRHNPVLVDGYAESLNFLATYVREGNKAGFSPRAMMSSAQALPANVRKHIEEGFGTKVFDKYGSREFSGIAYQCDASDDHHVVAESYIVELLVEGRPALPGETGEIVITDLNNFSFPLIRYRVGDLAVAVDNSEPCKCGRSQPRIGRIEGRTQAIVKTGNGTWMPGAFFAHFFKDYEPVIRYFQIHQKEAGSFTLKIVKGEGWTPANFAAVMGKLANYIGAETIVKIEYVEQIPLLRTGKRSPIVSELKYDFQEERQDGKLN